MTPGHKVDSCVQAIPPVSHDSWSIYTDSLYEIPGWVGVVPNELSRVNGPTDVTGILARNCSSGLGAAVFSAVCAKATTNKIESQFAMNVIVLARAS